MGLNTLFKKPIDRTIEGVIKADDETGIRIEAEEYVLTNEVAKRLEAFLDAYNNYDGVNGVWISGFFGSGKSHLLKMLALLLENRHIDDAPVLDIFLTKCGDNEILRGDLKRAVAIPSKSILFNIDQKADVISKTEVDALLAVFVKVFDEMCGYFGKQGHIAQFERELDEEGLFQDFKTRFNDETKQEWEFGRKRTQRFSAVIDKLYSQLTNQQLSGVIDKYKADYKVSIEDFAEQVHSYIQQQEANFRLNFFVDEVGQYIANNIKLMTNLQTIAESLATKCHGQAWVVVTAQEDMSTVVGEMNKQQGNDFTKIQARFLNRLKLTSTDVAEVIQKRLLMKNDSGVELLSDLYHQQTNNFKTLFDFAEGSQSYRNYQDRDHFIHCYPFVPYQFDLFQTAIQNLSLHNAFEGKHSSVGERSMLGVFQQVAIQVSQHEPGQLATFDLMFEGIRTSLKSQIQQAILVAERNLQNEFAIHLLKALFLVKYVKEFKATIRNLCVLMLNGFDQDMSQLRNRVEEALDLLVQQIYIQRNGDQYEFLTDEEKDVEKEIQNTDVETTDVSDELAKIIFDNIIKQRKIRYEDNGQDYPYSRKLDDRLVGRESELTIHVVTAFHPNAECETTLMMHSMGRDELLVIMPPDARLIHDILMYKRTEKYIRQNISVTQQDAIKRILTDKSFQNRERFSDLQQRLSSLLGKAKLFVSGDEIELGGEDAQNRIIRGFIELINRAYPNLRMLRGISYTENDIATCLQPSDNGLLENDGVMLGEAEQDMLAFIQNNQRSGERTTLKKLTEQFERKPYGWCLYAILCTLAKLCGRGKLEVRVDSNPLEDAELVRSLKNTHSHANVILEPQVEFTASQLRRLKEFYEDFFDEPPKANEARTLAKETSDAIQALLQSLTSLETQASQYPFKQQLETPIQKLKDLVGKPYAFYITELSKQEDDLLDMKEHELDPIRRFMGGPHKKLYDEINLFIQTQEPNFAYIEDNQAQQIQDILTDSDCYKDNHMQQAKTLTDAVNEKINTLLQQEKQSAAKSANAMCDRLMSMDEYAQLSAEHQNQLKQAFEDLIQKSQSQTLIAVISDTLRRFEEHDYQQLLAKMCEWAKPPVSQADAMDTEKGQTVIAEPKVEYTTLRSLTIAFEKAWLADEADVEHYLLEMKEAMMKEIQAGNRVQV
jgi:hypothetical protein